MDKDEVIWHGEVLNSGVVVDTCGGDFTYADYYLYKGKTYEVCYGAKPSDDDIDPVDE